MNKRTTPLPPKKNNKKTQQKTNTQKQKTINDFVSVHGVCEDHIFILGVPVP